MDRNWALIVLIFRYFDTVARFMASVQDTSDHGTCDSTAMPKY